MHSDKEFIAGATTLTSVPARAAVVRRRPNQCTYAISGWDQVRNVDIEVLITVPPPAMGSLLGTVQPIPGTQTYSVILGQAGVEPLAGLFESLSKNSRLVLDMTFDGSALTSFSLRRPEAASAGLCDG